MVVPGVCIWGLLRKLQCLQAPQPESILGWMLGWGRVSVITGMRQEEMKGGGRATWGVQPQVLAINPCDG